MEIDSEIALACDLEFEGQPRINTGFLRSFIVILDVNNVEVESKITSIPRKLTEI